MTSNQRKSIQNAVWLCVRCSLLVDKDELLYPTPLLKAWKRDLENENRDRLAGKASVVGVPRVDVELTRKPGFQMSRGFSLDNSFEIRDGKPEHEVGPDTIFIWQVRWNFTISITNNSSVPIINLAIAISGDTNLEFLTKLPKANNLQPFDIINVDARLEDLLAATSDAVRDIRANDLPPKLQKSRLQLTFYNEARTCFSTNWLLTSYGLLGQGDL